MSDVDLPSEIAVSLGPTDLSEVVPVKFLADAVVIVADKATGEPALVIIIEPQGRDDPTKEFSWPVYLTVARRHLQCQRAFLLVICPDPDEAKKCRRLISTGHPGFDLPPEVIDPLNAARRRQCQPLPRDFRGLHGRDEPGRGPGRPRLPHRCPRERRQRSRPETTVHDYAEPCVRRSPSETGDDDDHHGMEERLHRRLRPGRSAEGHAARHEARA